MVKVFIGNLFTSESNKNKYQKECFKKGVYCIGWALEEKPINIDAYAKIAVAKWKDDKGKENTGLNKAISAMRKVGVDDFIWSRCSETGKYWLGKVTKNATSNFYSLYDNKYCLCVSCDWREYNMDKVPGVIVNSFRGGTIKQSHVSEHIVEYCEFIHSNNLNKKFNKSVLRELLHYDDQEDLLGLYLQKEKDFLLYPSTNKMGTAAYEYVLVNKNNKCRAIVQCKMGSDNIYLEPLLTYKDFQIYCITDEGKICNNDIEKKEYDKFPSSNIHYLSLNNLLDWAKDNKNILPDRIRYYLELPDIKFK